MQRPYAVRVTDTSAELQSRLQQCGLSSKPVAVRGCPARGALPSPRGEAVAGSRVLHRMHRPLSGAARAVTGGGSRQQSRTSRLRWLIRPTRSYFGRLAAARVRLVKTVSAGSHGLGFVWPKCRSSRWMASDSFGGIVPISPDRLGFVWPRSCTLDCAALGSFGRIVLGRPERVGFPR